eukprot:Opistho-2@74617
MCGNSSRFFSLLGAAFFILLLETTDSPFLKLACVCLAMMASVFHVAGSMPNPQDIAPTHAGLVFGMMNTAGALSGVVGIAMTGSILRRTQSWALVFQCIAAWCVFGSAVFYKWGTAERLI